MKHKLLLFLLISAIKLEAQTFNDGVLEYWVTSNINNYVSVGIYNNTCPTGEFTIPETIEYSGVTYTINNLRNGAFAGCSGLTSINLPNTLISLGSSTFKDCSGLTNIDLSKTNVTFIRDTNFYNCTNLKSISFPSSLSISIGFLNFYNCTNLTNITVNSITPFPISINSSVFDNINLSTIELTVPKGTKSDYKRAYEWSDFGIIREEGLFFNDGIFEYLVIDETNNYVSVNKYNNVCVTGEITIPETIIHLGITYSITSIGHDTFENCSTLTSISIPNTVTIIKDSAFAGCRGLTSITIPDSVITIETLAFGFSGLTSVIIPDSVTSIGSSTFYFCSDLTSVTLGESVTSLEDGIFYLCEELSDINIPYSVTSIGYRTFFLCSGLTSINIPNSVTSIGDQAFRNCTGLTNVTVAWTSPLVINSTVFLSVSLEYIPLSVPSGTESIYQSVSIWQDFDIKTLNTIVFNEEIELQVYPNPAEDVLHIGLKKGVEVSQVNIYNLQGQHVLSSDNIAIDISNLKTGIYFVQVETNQGKSTKRVVIE